VAVCVLDDQLNINKTEAFVTTIIRTLVNISASGCRTTSSNNGPIPRSAGRRELRFS
jgi:hypothetical protein